MFDEVDSIGGTLKVADLGEFSVDWNDETLTIRDVNSDQLALIVQYIRNGPRAMDLVQKLADNIKTKATAKPETSAPPPPVDPIPAPELPPVVSKPRKAPEAAPVLAEPEPEASPAPGLDPAVVRREYERQAEAKKKAAEETAKAQAKAEAAEKVAAEKAEKKAAKEKAAKEKAVAEKKKAAAAAKKAAKPKAKAKPATAAPQADDMGDMFAFMLPEGVQDVPQIPDEAKAKLDAQLDKVNAAASALAEIEDTGWQVPLVGEPYDGEGVNRVTMKEHSVVLELASGTVVECDLQGTELQRNESDTPESVEDTGDALPQELATTVKSSKLVLHFQQRGMDKDAIIAAMLELKQAGHPALTNVDDVADRVGMML